MQNRGASTLNSRSEPSENRTDPQLAARLEKIRALLGPWTEPLLLSYAKYTRHPRRQAQSENLLRLCCEAALNVTRASGAALALRDGTGFTYRINLGETAPVVGTAIVSGSAFPAACIKTCQAFISNRALTDQRVDPALRQLGIRSLLVVPVLESGGALGFFEIRSRNEGHFNVKHILSLRVIAALLAAALMKVQELKSTSDYRHVLDTKLRTKTHSESSADLAGVPSNAEPAVPVNVAHGTAPINAITTAAPKTTSIPKKPGADAETPAAVLTPSFSKPAEQQRDEQCREVAAKESPVVTERRRHPRVPVDCLAYVSLGEENGGILLNISDAGFSIQIAFPLDLAGAPKCRVRFAVNGEPEADCELVWEQGGQAGFQISNSSAGLPSRLRSWIATNAVAVSGSS